VKTRLLTDLVRFGDDAARTEVVHETERLFTEVVCLQGAQGYGPVADPACDALITILAGEVSAQVGKGRARMRQWETVIAAAGQELTLRNASEEPSVVLLVIAPPPGHAERAGPVATT
jgi:quercetin dioxygenase-like cupin family protein